MVMVCDISRFLTINLFTITYMTQQQALAFILGTTIFDADECNTNWLAYDLRKNTLIEDLI